MNQRKHAANPQNALLDDLESIRTLLGDDAVADRGEQPPADVEVPVLEDIVASETSAAVAKAMQIELDPDPEPHTAADAPASVRESGLDDDLFQALLSDEWRRSAGEVLKRARTVIAGHRADWSPADTDMLNDVLKVRIDATIQGWMRGMVLTHMAELHDLLLQTLSEELEKAIEDIIEQRSETPDGQ